MAIKPISNNKVSDNDLKLILSAYHHWKVLNQSLKTFASRTVNFPEAISEALVCYELGYDWHNKTTTKNVGDASFDGKLIEIKATSNFDRDTSSFSPKTNFDILIFARLNLETDTLYIYNLNMDWLKFQTIQVSKTQSTSQQQENGRRPRFSIIKKIIEQQQLNPVAVMDLKDLANKLGVTATPV